MKKLLVFLAIVVCLTAGVMIVSTKPTKAETSGVWTYSLQSGGYATITGYSGNSSSVSIPSSIDGHRVIAIGNRVFDGNTALTSVTFPETLETIDYAAFQNCSSLTSITLPKSLTSIGYNAFDGCTKLANIVINSENLSNCSSYGTFGNVGKYSSSTVNVTFSNSVTNIPAYIFYDCGDAKIQTVTIGNSVKKIGKYAFENCYNLANINMNSSVLETIDYAAFQNCSGLTSITLPKSLTSIGYNAFNGCTKLANIVINSEKLSNCSSYGTFGNVGKYSSSTVTVTFSNSVTNIPAYIFYDCGDAKIQTVTIGNSVKQIGKYAFENCYNLANINMNSSVLETIDYAAFQNCSGLTSITLPKSLTSIGYNAFNNCKNATIKIYSTNCSIYDNSSTLGVPGSTKIYGYIGSTAQTYANKYGYTFYSLSGSLSTPTVSASNVAKTGKIELTISQVSGASYYYVYRKVASSSGDYTNIGYTFTTTYTDTSASAGVAYKYSVKAANSSSQSSFSNVVERTCDLPRPVVKIQRLLNSGKIKLTWDAVPGAVKYKVYRSTSENGTYKLIKTTTKTSFINKSISVGQRYYYRVRAVAQNTDANSAKSLKKTAVCRLPRPVVSITRSSGKPYLTWGNVSGASYYYVYRSTSKSGTYSYIGYTYGSSYRDASAKKNITYYYKVVAVYANNTAANSARSQAVHIKSH